jgi:hypothetical protein
MMSLDPAQVAQAEALIRAQRPKGGPVAAAPTIDTNATLVNVLSCSDLDLSTFKVCRDHAQLHAQLAQAQRRS